MLGGAPHGTDRHWSYLEMPLTRATAGTAGCEVVVELIAAELRDEIIVGLRRGRGMTSCRSSEVSSVKRSRWAAPADTDTADALAGPAT
jgi:hypothetical protein